MSAEKHCVTFALRYVGEFGVPVFPVYGVWGLCSPPGKHPLTANGPRDASVLRGAIPHALAREVELLRQGLLLLARRVREMGVWEGGGR
jgi:hypothetical protein